MLDPDKAPCTTIASAAPSLTLTWMGSEIDAAAWTVITSREATQPRPATVPLRVATAESLEVKRTSSSMQYAGWPGSKPAKKYPRASSVPVRVCVDVSIVSVAGESARVEGSMPSHTTTPSAIVAIRERSLSSNQITSASSVSGPDATSVPSGATSTGCTAATLASPAGDAAGSTHATGPTSSCRRRKLASRSPSTATSAVSPITFPADPVATQRHPGRGSARASASPSATSVGGASGDCALARRCWKTGANGRSATQVSGPSRDSPHVHSGQRTGLAYSRPSSGRHT